MADDIRKKIRSYMTGRLKRLQGLPENLKRAELAELRRGIGHIPGDIPTLWGAFLTDLPEELYGKDGEVSHAEWAIYTALTMFALHQQGHDVWMHEENKRFGRAVRELAPVNNDGDDDLKRIRSRFNRIATASDMLELANHLRGMVRLLSTNKGTNKEIGIQLDYVQLACDIYDYALSLESRSRVRLRWGQDFCRIKNENGIKETDEQ